MSFKFAHFNFNVTDLQKSLDFYEQALGLKEKHHIDSLDNSYKIIYLTDGESDFELELTWLKEHPEKYDLGECEFHLALAVKDFEAAFAKHTQMGCVCFVNEAMGIYFIEDPDGYWIEIIPQK